MTNSGNSANFEAKIPPPEAKGLTQNSPKVEITNFNYPATDHGIATALRDNGVGHEIQYLRGVGWQTWDWDEQQWVKNQPQDYLGKLGRQFRDKGSAIIANKLENWNSANNILKQMENMAAFTKAEWDSNPDLVGIGNQVYNVRTREVRAQNPKDYISISIPTKYNPKAVCPRFDRFMEEVQPNEDVRSYLQKLLGTGLLPRVPDQTFHFWLGNGSNGKGVLANAVSASIGPLAGTLSSDIFMKHSDESATRFALSRNQRCNLLIASEINKGAILAENKFKQLTGEEPTVVEEKNKIQESVTFHATLIMLVNEIPRISDDSFAMRRRVRVVLFQQQFDPHSGQNIGIELAQEKEGILLWLLEGAHKFVLEGMGYPEIIKDMTQNSMRQSFQMSDFLSEVVVVDEKAESFNTDIKKVYQQWCTDNGIPRIRPREQDENIKAYMNGIATWHNTGNKISYRGVRIDYIAKGLSIDS